MSMTDQQIGLGLRRFFTAEDADGYEGIEWGLRDARITDYRDGSVAFEQEGVEFPVDWSVNASNIVAQKYFRGTLGTTEREWSLRQVIDRVADTITEWGDRDGYFAAEVERETFRAELKHLLVTQRMAFNSPVWFNIGVPGVPNQGSACFILSVEDSLDSILDWYREEGVIFKGGSGAGVNLSRIRASAERLRGGGAPSGPVSFMRGADASAGTIKSGGKTRRAAKMVILDVDHPDIEEFVTCKAHEERKARALRAAGFDMDLDGADSYSVQYQNANNSVRVTDEFMEAVEADAPWPLIARTTGEVTATVSAAALMRAIATAAWECADPGMQYDSTINRWHTAAVTGRINASNPCSEYMHLDNSACNLASLNLLSFLDEHGTFDHDGFRAAVTVTFVAQEILVGNADYPTEKIARNTRRFRQLGLGYTNLGAMLMALGLPYDSDEGRAWAAAVTALMSGHAYETSARMAGRMGPFAGFHENREPMLHVLEMHRDEVNRIDEELVPADLLGAAQQAWDEACRLGTSVGVRNAQATVLAPTGTISFMMDADTTGIEPDLGLVKTKKLVGGGTMSIVNRTVRRALDRLGYPADVADAIEAHIDENHSVVGAPGLRPEHVAVFACSMGDNVVHYNGHLKMMAAAQPFLSGAISKTVNTPETTTVEEIEKIYLDGWHLGLKAVAVYRDNCKVGQPLSTGNTGPDTAPGVRGDATIDSGGVSPERLHALVEAAVGERGPVRERLPRARTSRTFEFRVADCKGFVTVGHYDDGRPGELFVRVSKQGSTLAGIMDAFAIAVSHGLQYGVPLRAYVEAFVGMRFEPAGMTDDADLRLANSLMDYLFRRLALDYMSYDERAELGLFSVAERTQPTLPGVEESAATTAQGHDIPPHRAAVRVPEGPLCMQCGVAMQRRFVLRLHRMRCDQWMLVSMGADDDGARSRSRADRRRAGRHLVVDVEAGADVGAHRLGCRNPLSRMDRPRSVLPHRRYPGDARRGPDARGRPPRGLRPLAPKRHRPGERAVGAPASRAARSHRARRVRDDHRRRPRLSAEPHRPGVGRAFVDPGGRGNLWPVHAPPRDGFVDARAGRPRRAGPSRPPLGCHRRRGARRGLRSTRLRRRKARGAPQGASVAFAVTAPTPVRIDIVVDGRAAPVAVPVTHPTAMLQADLTTFAALWGGREPVAAAIAEGRLLMDGDPGLARAVAEHLGYMI
ncbi:MAG: vitamin B12-dependent ribonucleotide reductase [Microthrixaceae bacterium]